MASLQERLLPYANGNANMAITYDEDGRQSRTITERKRRLAQLGPDFEINWSDQIYTIQLVGADLNVGVLYFLSIPFAYFAARKDNN